MLFILALFLLLADILPSSHGFVNPTSPRAAVTLASPHIIAGSSTTTTTTTTSTFTSTQHSSGRRFMAAQEQEDDVDKDEKNAKIQISSPLDRPVLAVVDFVALLGFAAVGKASHAADGSIDFLAVLSVAFPFLVSWFLTSPLTGVYEVSTRNKDGPLWNEAITTAKGWIVAVPIGIALRGVIKGYVPPTPFIIVTMIATLVILCGSRVLFSIAEDFFVELVN
jgi:hypothetical protein